MQKFLPTSCGNVLIEPGKLYVVYYSDHAGVKISYGCYLRDPNDMYIGKDDMYGSHEPRFYLNGLPQAEDVQVLRVMSPEAFRGMTFTRLFPDD